MVRSMAQGPLLPNSACPSNVANREVRHKTFIFGAIPHRYMYYIGRFCRDITIKHSHIFLTLMDYICVSLFSRNLPKFAVMRINIEQ